MKGVYLNLDLDTKCINLKDDDQKKVKSKR